MLAFAVRSCREHALPGHVPSSTDAERLNAGRSRFIRSAGPFPYARQRRRVVLAVVGAAMVAALGVGAWSWELRDRFVPKRFGVVVPGEIYRSGQISRGLIAGVIDRYHIGTIVDLNGFEPGDKDQQAEVAVAESKRVRHFRFPLRGNATGQIERYADALQVMVHSQQAGVPVLVHCYAGTQRTGACIAFYRLLVRGERSESVYQELVRYGWYSASDQVLVDYVNSHMRSLAELLVQRHVLDRVPEELPILHP